MAKRRIGSGIAAVAIVAALTAAVAWTTTDPGDVEAVPVVESPAPVESWEAVAGPEVGNDPGQEREAMAPPAAPELLAAGLPELQSTAPLSPTPAAASSAYSVESVDLPTGALLSQPVAGRKTSRFGNRFHPILKVWKLHTGLDFAAPCGTPVGAAAPGKVTKVGWAGGNGMQVRIDHGRIGEYNVVTTYNHLSAVGVRVGQEVAVHQGVGRVGNTGYSTGCHLHFEVIANGWYTNPEQWLNGEVVDIDTSQMTNQPVATPSPTPTVTATPSPSPTVTASPSPTASPTTSPTPTATASPSATGSPEPGCTPSPSSGPTANPTTTPCPPSPSPTCEETADQTPDPQDCTTVEPTTGPSQTASPTGSPTAMPTVTPTETAEPTADPTGSSDSTDGPSESTPGPTGPTGSSDPSDSSSPSDSAGTASPSSTAGTSPTGTQQATTAAGATPTAEPGSTAATN